MTTLYNLLMIKVEIILSILKLFNLKIRKFVNERKSVIQILEKEIDKNVHDKAIQDLVTKI